MWTTLAAPLPSVKCGELPHANSLALHLGRSRQRVPATRGKELPVPWSGWGEGAAQLGLAQREAHPSGAGLLNSWGLPCAPLPEKCHR